VCPNILEGESYDNFVDIWAIGVLAYEMIIGKAPFYHISRQ
jgi:serine/threonine protein kinase